MFIKQRYIVPHFRAFNNENISPVKISSFNRIFIPMKSNRLLPKILTDQNNQLQIMNNIEIVKQSSHEQEAEFQSQQQVTSPTFIHEQSRSFPSSVLVRQQHTPLVTIDEHAPIEHSILYTNKTEPLASVIEVERPLSSSLSQLIPDSIIDDKQAVNRIFNEKTSTHFLHRAQLVTLTSMNSSSKKTSTSINHDDDGTDKSSNRLRYYQIGSIFTSTSTLIMHQNEVIAHATASDPFLSDTIFIIIIATLTIIVLLFCLGLFCLCRRTTKRNISPSFDGGSYIGLPGHSFAIPINDYQQQSSIYENDIPSSSMQRQSTINHPSSMTDRILLPQTVALHHTAKRKAQMSKNKLKKKRAGFCCCNAKQTPSTIVNARTRIKRSNEM